MRLLLVAPNWIGDTLLAQPLLARLRARHPGLRIDAIAPEAGGESGARDMLQRRRADLAKKKVVVWLASEQIFRVGESWEPSRIFE